MSAEEPPGAAALAPLLLAAAAAALLGLCWAGAPKRPVLAGGPRLVAFLRRRCPAVRAPFRPTAWCPEGRLQTVLRALLQSCPTVRYRSESIRTPDGGQLVLDWADGCALPAARPTVLLLPGLAGSSQASYVLHMVHGAARAGYRAVVLNNRGCRGEELLVRPSPSPPPAGQGRCRAETRLCPSLPRPPGPSAPATRRTWRRPSPTSGAGTRTPRCWLPASPWAGSHHPGVRRALHGACLRLQQLQRVLPGSQPRAPAAPHPRAPALPQRLRRPLLPPARHPGGGRLAPAPRGAAGDGPRRPHRLPGGPLPPPRHLHGPRLHPVHHRRLRARRGAPAARGGWGWGCGAGRCLTPPINPLALQQRGREPGRVNRARARGGLSCLHPPTPRCPSTDGAGAAFTLRV
ncbi:protein ABHD1 isoform X1 [Anser cygnoides]|uniref:protein ABHD1 isoform X1 n=1 Tax=Anser cygnoides TaxID=8845 RepID=UPI0034D33A31